MKEGRTAETSLSAELPVRTAIRVDDDTNGRFLTEQRLCLSMSDFHPDVESDVERQCDSDRSALLYGFRRSCSGSTSCPHRRGRCAETSRIHLRLDFQKYFPEKAAASQEMESCCTCCRKRFCLRSSKAPVAVRGGFRGSFSQLPSWQPSLRLSMPTWPSV